MKEIVKYGNELNKMGFSALSPNQQNILFTIFTLLKETDKNKMTIPLEQIIELAELDKTKNPDYLNGLLDKLKDLQAFTFRFEPTPKQISQVVIFPKIEIDKTKKTLKIEIDGDFKKMYLAVYSNFTRFYLKEFTHLPSTYTKTIYRCLRQFQTTGIWSINFGEFKELLGIPKSYRVRDIDKQILKPSLKILGEPTLFDFGEREIFENLSVEKVKDGKKIRSLKFCFEPIKESQEYKIKKFKKLAEQIDKDRMLESERIKKLYVGRWVKFAKPKNAKEPQRYGLILELYRNREEFGVKYAIYRNEPREINNNFLGVVSHGQYDGLQSLENDLKTKLI